MTKRTNCIRRTLLVLSAIIFINSGLVFTQNRTGAGKKTPYTVPRTSLPIKVDGSINEKAWENALVMELKYEFDPAPKAGISFRYRFFLLMNMIGVK